MYYSLFDRQTNRIMATGLNSRSISDLGYCYSEYISNDIDLDEEGDIKVMVLLRNGSDADIIGIINGNEFSVQESETPYCEDCNSTETYTYNDIETGFYWCKCRDCDEETRL